MSDERTIQQRLRSQAKRSPYIEWGHEAADELDRLSTALAAAEGRIQVLEDVRDTVGKFWELYNREVVMRFGKVYLIHEIDAAKLESVKVEMTRLGRPTIRVVDCGDHLMAIEGTHRLAAAADLGIVPDLTILEQDDLIDADSLDVDHYFQRGETYTAGEIAGELYNVHSVPLTINDDGTLSR